MSRDDLGKELLREIRRLNTALGKADGSSNHRRLELSYALKYDRHEPDIKVVSSADGLTLYNNNRGRMALDIGEARNCGNPRKRTG